MARTLLPPILLSTHHTTNRAMHHPTIIPCPATTAPRPSSSHPPQLRLTEDSSTRDWRRALAASLAPAAPCARVPAAANLARDSATFLAAFIMLTGTCAARQHANVSPPQHRDQLRKPTPHDDTAQLQAATLSASVYAAVDVLLQASYEGRARASPCFALLRPARVRGSTSNLYTANISSLTLLLTIARSCKRPVPISAFVGYGDPSSSVGEAPSSNPDGRCTRNSSRPITGCTSPLRFASAKGLLLSVL